MSPYTNLCHKIDLLKAVYVSFIDGQRILFTKIDSVKVLSNQMAVDQGVVRQQLDSITAVLNKMADYGMGYSDAASHITIPLLIALFAFAFPFLFAVISHINNKYDSELITTLFSSEPTYKLFLRGARIVAAYLVLMGILSLSFKGEAHQCFMAFLNWTSIAVAFFYSSVIVLFVHVCIDYNYPKKLIERIDVKFGRGDKEAKNYLKRIAKNEKKNEKEKKKRRRNFFALGMSVRKSMAYYGVENTRTLQLIEVCKYALRKQDYSLFQLIVMKVENMTHPEVFYKNQRFLFCEEVIESYLYTPHNSKIEERLIRSWFMAFDKSEIPADVLIYKMLGKMVLAVIQGRTSIFETYIKHVNYGLGFINTLQIVSYVRGNNIDEQKRIDHKRLELWTELCEMHYIAMAHLFSMGYYDAVRIVLTGKNTGYGRLFPSSGAEVLKVYARCKEKQGEDGNFNYLHMKEVVGDNTDLELLEKLTAFMLFVASEQSCQSLNLISGKRLNLIRQAENKLCDYAKRWLENGEIIAVFPQIRGLDCKERFDTFVEQLVNAEKVSEKEDNRGLFIRIIYGLMNLLCERSEQQTDEDIYQKEIPLDVKEKVKTMFGNILYGNASVIFDDLIGEESEEKTEDHDMGEFNFMTYKRALMETDGLYAHNVFNNVLRIFKSRYLYMVFNAIDQMNIIDKEVPLHGFEEFFVGYVGEHGDDYVIIDSDSHMNLYYKMDELDDGRKLSFNRTYKGAEYKHYDFNFGCYLSDIKEMDSYKETLVIIKKKDLPFVSSTSNPEGPDVAFYDESNKSKGIAAVSMTVNPNYKVKYSKMPEVMRVRLVVSKK